jgi:hypothetical protein
VSADNVVIMFHDPGNGSHLNISGFVANHISTQHSDAQPILKVRPSDLDDETLCAKVPAGSIMTGQIKERAWYGDDGMQHVRTIKEPIQSIPTFAETIALLMKVC